MGSDRGEGSEELAVGEGFPLVDPSSLPVSRAPTGPLGHLPSSLGQLPWHEAGTRPGWALGARLGGPPCGAGLRSWGPRGSLGQGPPVLWWLILRRHKGGFHSCS